MTDAPHIETELGDRLQRIYGLGRRPKNPREFFQLLRKVSEKSSGTQEFLRLVRGREAVIGQSDKPTKDWIAVKRKKIFTYCSYDTLMTAILQGGGELGSACPHCGDAMKVRIKGVELESFSPNEMTFWWGTGPEGSPGNPMCDHLHLFPDKEHMAAWIRSHEGEMGFSFKMQDGVRLLKKRF